MCSNKKTTEQFKEEVYHLLGDEYTILGDYINNNTPIDIMHNICRNVDKVRPYSILGGRRCVYCSGRKKKTTKQFKEDVYNLVGDEYTVLGEYKNNQTKIGIKHELCGHNYNVIPKHFLRGSRCAKCKGLLKKDTKQFEEEVYNLVGDEYTVLEEYVNIKTKILIKHELCRTEYKVSPLNFLNGSRCPKCNGNMKKTTEQFKKEVYNLVGEDYIVLGDYVNAYTKIKIKHEDCGVGYLVRPSDFLKGSRCYHCKESKGETKIRKYLNENMFKYLRECVIKSNRKCLRVDFMVIDNNNNYIAGIEYDGQQHYIPIDYFGGEKTLKQTQDRDKLKDEWFKKNNIKLIRIPYWEFKNIEFILKEELVNGNI